jgi:NADH-quinone oxidoreductase subunit H
MAGLDNSYVGNLLGCLNVLFKGVVGVSVMMWVRWTLPRLRIDQVMVTCLKYCTPIAAAMFLGAALWQYALPHRNFFGLMRAPVGLYAVDEGWPATSEPSQPADDESTPRTVHTDAPVGQVAAAHHQPRGG